MTKTIEQGREEIKKLCEYFSKNKERFRAPGTKEADVRQSLIDPFFEALGWDVNNKKKIAPQYREVVPEENLNVEGDQRAPDYAFRVGSLTKFYVEAKKCNEDIKQNAKHSFQLRRYGWSAKVGVSILTDFEELSIYECTKKPKESDAPKIGRTHYFTFDQYVERWQEIWDIFSYEAMYSGAFDQYISTKRKRGTEEVDDAFLESLDEWRDLLARNLAANNDWITNEELNTAVTLILDRIVFLRMAEDRGLEPFEQLLGLCNSGEIYSRFMKQCRAADDKYNSGLFHFQKEDGISDPPDKLTPKLKLEDKTLKTIFKNLYFAHGSPYHFGVMPIEILGTAYERFLGKVIRLTPSHTVKIEEKPEVRKAGGVYYTPSYIVDYIVKQTVGAMVEGKSPKEIAGTKTKPPLRVLDMACGSGSFLLGAYQFLLDHCLKWYMDNNPGKHPDAVYNGTKSGLWRLTIEEKKRILTTHIYGVDLDPQAVEVSKLSLLLKVLENENDQSVVRQRQLFHDRALPNLSDNIKCGNSLIGPDYFTGQLVPDPDDLRRVNPFDWKEEFPEAMKAGGFDCVIGNPPWGAEFDSPQHEYFRNRYSSLQGGAFDSYIAFIEQAFKSCSVQGKIGYITPDTFLRKDNFFDFRNFLLKQKSICELIESGPLFSQVRDTWCLILVAQNNMPKTNSLIRHRKISRYVVSTEDRLLQFATQKWTHESKVKQSVWTAHSNLIIGYHADEKKQLVISKIEKSPRISAQQLRFQISRGEEGSKFNIIQNSAGNFQMVIPADIEKYLPGKGVKVMEASLTPSKVRNFYQHPKIWVIRIQKMRWQQRIVCAFDGRINTCGMKTLQIITSPTDNTNDLKILSAIISSKLINFWCENYLTDDLNQSYLEKIPVPDFNSSNENKKGIARLLKLVDSMLELHKHLADAKSDSQKSAIQRQIDATDREIDALVYQLYELTDDEIAVVEGK